MPADKKTLFETARLNKTKENNKIVSILEHAAKIGDLKTIKFIEENYKNYSNNPNFPLVIAVKYGHTHIVQYYMDTYDFPDNYLKKLIELA